MEKSAAQTQKITALLAGLLFSYLVTGLSLLILALLLWKLDLEEGKITAGIIIIYMISCFLGGWLTGKRVTNRKFFWGMILGLLYSLILTAVSAITEPGISAGAVTIGTSFFMCMASGMLGGMLA